MVSGARPRPRLRQRADRPTDADSADLAAFRTRHFGAESPQADERHAAWLFLGNPVASAESPDVWICRKDGRIVGQQCGIPVRLKVGSTEVRASWAIDLVVDPDWRMRGVAPALSEAQAASADLALGVNVSTSAFRAYRRAGWLDLGNVPIYVRPLRVSKALDAARVSRIPRALGLASDLPLRALDRLLAAGLRAAGFELRAIEQFDEEVDQLWRKLAPAYPVLARRDLEWVRWRFDEGPRAPVYRRFYLTRAGRTLGYIVVRAERWRGEPFCVVADYFVGPPFAGVLFALALREARTEGAVALACRTLNVRAHPWLRSLAFARMTITTEEPVRFLALPGPRAAGLPLLGEPNNWFVTAADSDLDHERPQAHEGTKS